MCVSIKLIGIALSHHRRYTAPAQMSAASYGSDYVYPAIVPPFHSATSFLDNRRGGHLIREMIICKAETEICCASDNKAALRHFAFSARTSSEASLSATSSNNRRCAICDVRLHVRIFERQTCTSKMRTFEIFARI